MKYNREMLLYEILVPSKALKYIPSNLGTIHYRLMISIVSSSRFERKDYIVHKRIWIKHNLMIDLSRSTLSCEINHLQRVSECLLNRIRPNRADQNNIKKNEDVWKYLYNPPRLSRKTVNLIDSGNDAAF